MSSGASDSKDHSQNCHGHLMQQVQKPVLVCLLTVS